MSRVAADPRAAFFTENGYYLHRESVLKATETKAARDGVTALREGRYDTGRPPFESPWKPGDDPSKLCKIEQPQLASHRILKAISCEALGRAAAAVSGAEMVQVWWVQLLYKPPATEGAKPAKVGWHQDAQYWGEWTPDSGLFTAWLALSDVDEEAGPMKFVPKTHMHGILPGGDFFSDELESQQAAFQLPPGVEWQEVSATLPPGGVSFHHRHLIHGSSTNTSDQPRISLAIHLRTENSTIKPGINRVLTGFVDDTSVCPIIYDG